MAGATIAVTALSSEGSDRVNWQSNHPQESIYQFWQALTTRSDAADRFSPAAVPLEEGMSVEIRAPGQETVYPFRTVRAGVPPVTDLGRITGQIVFQPAGGGEGRPLLDALLLAVNVAEVDKTDPTSPTEYKNVPFSDAQSRYGIEHLPPGVYNGLFLRPQRRGLKRVAHDDAGGAERGRPCGGNDGAEPARCAGQDPTWAGGGPGHPRASERFAVAFRRPEPVVIQTKRGAVVSGRMLDPKGQPVSGVQVGVLMSGPASEPDGETIYGLTGWPDSVVTAQDGTFSGWCIPAGNGGQTYLVAEDHRNIPGHTLGNGHSEPFLSMPGDAHEATIHLTAGGWIEGIIVDAKDRPPADVPAVAAVLDHLDGYTNHVGPKTDAQGRFRLGPLRPAEHEVRGGEAD